MSNKENIGTNKFEGPKLRMEPVQMKKKKKGGGYNLRKSIAWNRAFFTEEGVLDPEELSLISGTQASSSREGISAINEEAMDSLVEDCQFINGPADLQALEKNLFKGTPACSQENRETSYLPPKNSLPVCFSQASTSMASRKVLSTPRAIRAGSISGASPSPLPSPSLKRPANISACKFVPEESKLPKVPVSKPRHVSLSKSNIRGTAPSMKNQILQPVVNKQRNAEPRSYRKSVNIPKSKPKDGSESLPVKSSALHPKRSKVNPPINMPPSIRLCSPQGNEVGNSGPKVIQEDGPRTIKVNLSEDKDATAQLGDSLPSNNVITGRALQHPKFQSNKPSGLRMPSPSLGFFDQSKASASSRFSRRVVDSYSRVEKLGNKRPLAKVPQVLDSNVLSANSLVSSSRYELDALSNTSITPDAGEDAGKNGKKILDKYEHYGLENDEQMMMCITGSEEKFQHHAKNETSITLEEDRGVETNDSKMLLITEPRKHLLGDGNANNCILGDITSKESTGSKDAQFLSQQNFAHCAIDVAGTSSTVKSPCKEEKFSNFAVTEHEIAIEFRSGEMNNSKLLNSAMLGSNFVSCVSDVHQPSRCLSDDLESSTGEKHTVTDVCNPPILEEVKSEKLTEHTHSSASEIIGNKNFMSVESDKFELEDPSFSSECMYVSQSEDSVIRGDMTDQTQGQETPLQIPNSTLTANMNENSLDQSSETGDLSNPSGTLLELQTACLKVEHISKDIHGLPSDECWLLEKDTGSEEYQNYVFETSPLVLSDKRGKSEIDNSDTLISDVFRRLKGESVHANRITSVDSSELGFVQAADQVVNQECLLHRNASSVAYLSNEPRSVGFLSCSSEVSEIGDNKTLTISEPARQDLFDGSYLENQVADISQTSFSLFESKVCDEDQRCDLQSVAETEPTLPTCSPIELERDCRSPQVANVMEKGKVPIESVETGNFSQTGDDSGHFTGGYDPVLTISHTSVMCDVYVEGTNYTVEPGQPELPSCCILVKEIPEDKNKLLPGNCWNEERAEAENFEESTASGSGAHTVPHKGEPCKSELRSSKAISNATLKPLPSQANVDDENESNDWPSIEDLRSSCVEIQPSFAKNKLPSGSELRHDAQFGGLLFQGDLTFPEGKNQSVGLMVGSFIDETRSEVCQNRDSLVGDTKYDFVTLCHEDEKATAEIGSKKSTRTSNEKNLTILPPRNAVPFSDEWLAAIEAAGEEILTMKSGAVQNSPPDKSLPEPSPWSPVRRKTNSIGPYDCTKFTTN